MNRLTHILVSILALAAFGFAAGEPDDAEGLTLKTIFSERAFSPRIFGPARWLDEGDKYTTLEPSPSFPEHRDIVEYITASGKRNIRVPAAKLIPPGKKEPLEIADYRWSKDQRFLLIFSNTRRVWRANTRGDYWVLHMKNWRMKKLGGDAPPSSLMFAHFSPGGNRVAYVRENNLYVESINSEQQIQLTRDGSKTTINGTGDWVYEEEFGLRDGFRWSPDGSAIAFWQFDSSDVPLFTLVDNTSALYPRLTRFPYPKAGETNSACRIGVIPVTGGTVRWIPLPGNPRDYYIPRMSWAPDGGSVILQRLNRLQNTNRLMAWDRLSGDVRQIFSDTDSAWVDVCDHVLWLSGSRDFTWVSERDGWRRLYRCNRETGTSLPIHREPFDLIRVNAVIRRTGQLYFTASPDDPTRHLLFRVPLDGRGKAHRVTPAGQGGWHSYDISPDGHWAFHQFSDFGIPPCTELIRLPAHSRQRILEDNTRLKARLSSLPGADGEFFRIAGAEGDMLDGWCIRPAGFNATHRYPALFYVYGEPAGQTVTRRWGGNTYLWHRFLAQKGFVVISIDNRGTPAPRGRGWRKSVYRKIGVIASEDQAAACRHILEDRPWIDPRNVAVWGWSGGGSMTLNMMFRHPELYATGIAVAPVSDIRYYDSIYQERYMGLPQSNTDDYSNASPITFAHQLQGRLLVVHGTGDDNVHYQATEALINALVQHDRPFSMMAYPNRSHAIREGKNTSIHLFSTLTRFLETGRTGP